ncbi:MAG: glycosyltransferase [Novosphingobium sp.]
MAHPRGRRIGILFCQFAAYHVDRCAAAARLLAECAEVVAVEVATTSATYAWPASGEVGGATKRTLFPGRSYEEVPRWRRFRAQFAALRDCDTVFVGVGYNEPDVLALAVALRLIGRRVILMTESKFDDMPRRLFRELAKAALLSPFHGAIVGGPRHAAYMRLLGFRRRPVVTGYDSVDLARVRTQGGGGSDAGFAERPFVFVGRFVAKKNLPFLLEAYRLYRERAGNAARGLVLVGGGDLEPQVCALVESLGLVGSVEITGFVDAPQVAVRLAGAVALLLPSREEQWGLVVNEALAFGLPVVVSEAVGARDLLVRNLVNGFVLPADDAAGWAQAMATLGGDEALWQRMRQASRALAPAGDAVRFAEAVAAFV